MRIISIETILDTLGLIIDVEKMNDNVFGKDNKDKEFIEMIKYFYSQENREYVNLIDEGDEESYTYKNPFAYVRVLDILEAIIKMRKMNIRDYN